MNLRLNKNLLLRNNLHLILNTMIPGDNYMPSFTKAVRVEDIIKKFKKNKFILNLDLDKKENWDNCVKILGNNILDAYFTSNSVIKALNLRKKKFLKNVKKESMFKLLKKVKRAHKKFKK